MVDGHPGIFHMEDFHDVLVAVYKNKNSPVLNMLPMLFATMPLRV
jgi:hypothetical protein